MTRRVPLSRRRERHAPQFVRPVATGEGRVPPLLQSRLGISPRQARWLRGVSDRVAIAGLLLGFLLLLWMARDLPALLGS